MTLRELGKPLELVKAAATRFGSHTLVGARLLELMSALQATVCSADYVAKKYKDTGNTIEDGGTGRRSYSNKGGTCKKLVQDDEGFWVRVRKHVHATEPIFKFLRRVDTGSPTLGKLYSGWFELGEFLNSAASDFKQVAWEKWNERWAYGHSDVSAAAYVVDPEFHGHDQGSNAEVTDGFTRTLVKIGILNEVRRMADESDVLSRLWKKRAAFVAEDPSNWTLWTHYPSNYPTNNSAAVKNFCIRASQQLLLYRNRQGVFAQPFVFDAAETEPAAGWWETYGASVPELRTFAMLLLSQPSSASICERINSEFAFVKDPKRNRLGHEKANKLVALFHNLRLLYRAKKPNYTEPMVGWNEDDKKTGLVKFGVTHYEPPGSQRKKIPCPIRPPVIFTDHETKPNAESFAAFQIEMTSPGFQEELEKARDNPKSKEAGNLIQRLKRFITTSGVKIPSPECDAFNEADLNLPHLGLA